MCCRNEIGGKTAMLTASRIWVGLLGILSIWSALPHWFQVEGLAAERGVQAIGLIGRANVRADMGGIFIAIGVLALIASCRRSTVWLLAAIIVPASAFAGRLASLMIDGYSPRIVEPIIVEITVLALFGAALWIWRKAPEGL
jgi:hypothetical protein